MNGDLEPTDVRRGDSSNESMRVLSRNALEDLAAAKTLFIPSEKLILSKLFEEVIPRTSSRIWAEDWRAGTRGRHNPGLQSYTETDRTRLV